MTKKRELYIDADVLVYESAFAAQKTVYHYKDMVFKDAEAAKAYCVENELDYRTLRKEGEITSDVQVLPENVASNILRQKIANIRNELVHGNWHLVLSGGDENFRDEVAVTKKYKGNRENVPKPVHFDFVRSLVHGHEKTICEPGIEADDVLGIALTQDPEAILASIDKDLCQIPGRHFDWNKGIKFFVKPSDALYFFHRQLLMGDSTDNIPGIPGLGEKKAIALLAEYRTDPRMQWKLVVATYKDSPLKFKDGTEVTLGRTEYLNEQGRLLWMMRQPDEVWTADYYEEVYV